MRHPKYKGKHLIVYLDDASRCITAGVFEHDTSENNVTILHDAIQRFKTPAQILSDNGSQFTSRRHRESAKSWNPTVFENDLLCRRIDLINSHPYHPQTSDKLDWFFRTLDEEMSFYGDLGQIHASLQAAYYNNREIVLIPALFYT